jgi:hypothetical protein
VAVGGFARRRGAGNFEAVSSNAAAFLPFFPNPEGAAMATGRPGKLTTEVREKICAAVSAGSYIRAACNYAGIDRRTFSYWLARGKKARKGIYRDFYLAVRKAEADCEVATVAAWKRSMPENPGEYRHFLARRYPARWSERGRLELTGKGGGPVRSQVSVADLSDQELHALIDQMLGVRGRAARNGKAPREPLPAGPAGGRGGDDDILTDGSGCTDA